jgi:hypothetical protein
MAKFSGLERPRAEASGTSFVPVICSSDYPRGAGPTASIRREVEIATPLGDKASESAEVPSPWLRHISGAQH